MATDEAWGFDQTFLQRPAGVTTTDDPCRKSSPSYIFRWGSTRTYHGQALMQGPRDVEWYERATDVDPSGAIEPGLDAETLALLDKAPNRSAAVGDWYKRA